MAQKGPRRAPNVDNKDVLLCDICMERYDDGQRRPKFLSCHHSYCQSCLSQVAGDQENMECPSCRQVTTLSAGGVGSLQTNFYIGRLQDTLKQAGIERARGCKKHGRQPMSFFCAKCCVMICRDCTVLDHKEADGHVIQDLTMADSQLRERLRSKVKVATETFEQVQNQLGHLEAEAQNISTAREELQSHITSACERYNKLLEARKVQLLKEVTDEYSSRRTETVHNAGAIGSKLQRMAKSLSNAERLTRQGPLSDVISISATLEQTSTDLQQLILSMDLGTEELQFDSTVGEAEFQTSVSKLGSVFTENTLPSCIDYTSEPLTSGLPASVSVHVVNSDGKTVSEAGIDFIVSDKNGDKLHKTLTWEQTGTGALTFTPQISGDIQLQATFRGRSVQFGRTTVTVRSNDPVSKFGRPGAGRGQFSSPRAVAVDQKGFLYVADTGNKVIQKLDGDGHFVCQFDIGKPESDNSTCDITLCDSDTLVVCTETSVGSGNQPTSGNTVLIYSQDGQLQRKFNNRAMRCALCVATNKHNEILVSDYLKHCLFMYDINGKFLRKVGHSNDFNHPAFICVTADDHIIVTDTNTDSVHVFDREGAHLRKFGRSGSSKGELKQPFGVGSDGQYIVVVDSGNARIQVFRMDGTFVSVVESLGDPLSQPRGVALTDDGHVYVTDRDNNCIKKYRYK